MTNAINIELKRTGFPVKIGEVELFFDSSLENLLNFINIEEVAKEKIKEVQEKAKNIHFPEGFEDLEASEYTKEDLENVDTTLDLNKEFIAIQYDIIFRDGTFKKLYEKYPDMAALEQLLDPIGKEIAKRIEQLGIEHSNNMKKINRS